MLNHKRSDLEVAADILRISGSQTAIMYGANLSYAQTRKYLRQLAELALIESVERDNGRRHYHSTGKGQEFLQLIEKLEVLVGSPTY